MANAYKSFYFADLKALIRETALDIMIIPAMDEDEENGTKRNANIAIYNDGIRTFADALIDKLTEETTEESKDEV